MPVGADPLVGQYRVHGVSRTQFENHIPYSSELQFVEAFVTLWVLLQEKEAAKSRFVGLPLTNSVI